MGAHMKRIVIYMPSGSCDLATEGKILRHFPEAEFVTSWRDGALMWQDALARAERV